MVKRITKNTVEVIANVLPKQLSKKEKKNLFCSDRKAQIEKESAYIRERDISYGGMPLNKLLNLDNRPDLVSYITFEVEAMYKPSTPLFITKDKKFKKEGKCIYFSSGTISARNMHWFYAENTEAFSEVKKVISDSTLWQEFKTDSVFHKNRKTEETSIISILRQENNELAYSNMLQFFFCADKTVFHNFAKKILNVEISNNYTVEREKDDIDLLITDENNVIVIENKLQAKLSPDQLKKYAEAAEKMRNGRNLKLFVLRPDYNDVDFAKVEAHEKYTEITYSQLYKFFREDRLENKYFDDFLFALQLHSVTAADHNADTMRERFIQLINSNKE